MLSARRSRSAPAAAKRRTTSRAASHAAWTRAAPLDDRHERLAQGIRGTLRRRGVVTGLVEVPDRTVEEALRALTVLAEAAQGRAQRLVERGGRHSS
jgi:hypothetical protein